MARKPFSVDQQRRNVACHANHLISESLLHTAKALRVLNKLTRNRDLPNSAKMFTQAHQAIARAAYGLNDVEELLSRFS